MAENHNNAVSLKLPSFWPETPEFWFSQAEAQFAIRNIIQDDTKYFYVIAAMDQTTAKRIMDFIKAPPQHNKYEGLKERLLHTYTLNEHQRASQLLHMSGLGDEKPSVLMDNMLTLIGDHEPCFLFRQIFMEQMPDDIRAHLIQSKLTDCRQMARAADELMAVRSYPISGMINKEKINEKHIETAPHNDSKCFYHKKFGAKAMKCQQPCSFKHSGNDKAGRP